MLDYVAYVTIRTGQINRCSAPQYNTPSNGIVVDDGISLVVYVTKDNMPDGCEGPAQLRNEYTYDMVEHKFVHIGLPPNPHAEWNPESGDWSWDSELLEQDVRRERNRLLTLSDWTQMSDSPLSSDMRDAWSSYRQELRDITSNLEGVSSLLDVNWPVQPQ